MQPLIGPRCRIVVTSENIPSNVWNGSASRARDGHDPKTPLLGSELDGNIVSYGKLLLGVKAEL